MKETNGQQKRRGEVGKGKELGEVSRMLRRMFRETQETPERRGGSETAKEAGAEGNAHRGPSCRRREASIDQRSLRGAAGDGDTSQLRK